MDLQRIIARERLNVSSDSPFVQQNRHVPLLGTSSPWHHPRSVISADSPLSTRRRFLTPAGKVSGSEFFSAFKKIRNENYENFGIGNSSFSYLPRRQLKTVAKCFKGNDLNSFSFSPRQWRKSLIAPQALNKGETHSESFLGTSTERNEMEDFTHCKLILNPNKSVLSVDGNGKILTVNDVASASLGYEEKELCGGMTLANVISNAKVVSKIKTALQNAKGDSTLQPLGPEESATEYFLPFDAEDDILDGEGMVVFSGKVITVRNKDGTEMPMSIWMKRLLTKENEDLRWLVVMEPVHIIVSTAVIDGSGLIKEHDNAFLLLFGEDGTTLAHQNILHYISSLKIPAKWDGAQGFGRQDCTGTSPDGVIFPLALSIGVISQVDNSDNFDSKLFEVKIHVCTNLSGLIVLDSRGYIVDYNPNFTRHLFGYGCKDLTGKNITSILPCFEKHMDNSSLCRSKEDFYAEDEDTTVPFIDESLKENRVNDAKKNAFAQISRINSEGSCSLSPNMAFLASESQSLSCFGCSHSTTGKSLSKNSSTTNHSSDNKGDVTETELKQNSQDIMKDITNSVQIFNFTDETVNGVTSEIPMEESIITSTPAVQKTKAVEPPPPSIEEGSYCGMGIHKNGSPIVITYHVRHLIIDDVPRYCLWVLWEPEALNMTRLDATNFSFQANQSWLATPCKDNRSKCESDFDSDDPDVSGAPYDTHTDGSSEGEYVLHHSRCPEEDRNLVGGADKVVDAAPNDHNKSISEDEESILITGDYNGHYGILKQIGRGAFGSVQLAYRKRDSLMVVTKFIKKGKVYKDSWREDPATGRRIPFEIAILSSLNHPNIVSTYEYFENDDYFQLIMEKWGCGMDLFEFIDRNPLMDEALASYIFRQIVSAIIYLRSKGILHRDIKDENVIINQEFHVKLIDFGSCTYLQEGQTFSQFAGTVEYCSPEILKGNQYSGPELEIWSLGITLYTLVHGENPFYSVDEILNSTLAIPVKYSEDLNELLTRMLEKDPTQRILLEDVAFHPWTGQEIDISLYRFGDIVQCSPEELDPKLHVSAYGDSEVSLSTTSSSFVYEPHSYSTNTRALSDDGSTVTIDSLLITTTSTSDDDKTSPRESESSTDITGTVY